MQMSMRVLIGLLRGDEEVAAGASVTDWLAVARLAEQHRVVALVARKPMWREHAPPDVVTQLATRARQLALQSLALTNELADVTHLLAAAGIPSIALKGPLLSWRLYGDIGIRVSDDLDLLIKTDVVLPACAVLEAAGYRADFALTGALGRAYLRNFHDYGLWTPRGERLELHWAWAQRRFAIDAGEAAWWCASQSLPTPIGEVGFLSIEHELVFLCVHAAKHAWSQLDLVTDVVAHLQHDAIEWRQVRAIAHELGVRRILAITLGLAHQLGARLVTEFVLDATGQQILQHVQHGWAHRAQTTTAARMVLDLRARERWQDQLRMLARTAFLTTPQDWSVIELPDRWFGLYGVVRLLRLSGFGRRAASEIAEQKSSGLSKSDDLSLDANHADRHGLHELPVQIELTSKS
jgi:hypothetical protein